MREGARLAVMVQNKIVGQKRARNTEKKKKKNSNDTTTLLFALQILCGQSAGCPAGGTGPPAGPM